MSQGRSNAIPTRLTRSSTSLHCTKAKVTRYRRLGDALSPMMANAHAYRTTKQLPMVARRWNVRLTPLVGGSLLPLKKGVEV
jgi:hypothetical protein